jgi:hypothetical protein
MNANTSGSDTLADTLEALSIKALETLSRLLDDPQTSPAERRRIAVAILNAAARRRPAAEAPKPNSATVERSDSSAVSVPAATGSSRPAPSLIIPPTALALLNLNAERTLANAAGLELARPAPNRLTRAQRRQAERDRRRSRSP